MGLEPSKCSNCQAPKMLKPCLFSPWKPKLAIQQLMVLGVPASVFLTSPFIGFGATGSCHCKLRKRCQGFGVYISAFQSKAVKLTSGPYSEEILADGWCDVGGIGDT